MTLQDAKTIWKKAGCPMTDTDCGTRWTPLQWEEIRIDVENIVNAKTDEYAARIVRKILGPWDTMNTAVAFARRMRRIHASTIEKLKP